MGRVWGNRSFFLSFSLFFFIFTMSVPLRADFDSLQRSSLERKCAELKEDYFRTRSSSKKQRIAEQIQSANRRLDFIKRFSRSTVAESSTPTLTSLLQGTFISYSTFDQLLPGDLIFENKGGVIGALSPLHLIVKGVDRTIEGTLCKSILEGGKDGLYLGCVSSNVFDRSKVVVFRPSNPEVGASLVSFMEHKEMMDQYDGKNRYSTWKGIKSFIERGGKGEIDRDDERRIVISLLQKEMNQGRGTSKDVTDHKEICSTYAGNALISAAVKTKLTSNDKMWRLFFRKVEEVFKNGTQYVRKNGSSVPPSVMKEFLENAADELLADAEFRAFMEFRVGSVPPSSVFQENINRMIPAKLLNFLIRLNENPCSPVISASELEVGTGE